ncbi:MAG TPA: peptide deformylase [Anaerolineales bacterium]|nr:peptide deformylase [Anaerolineales bacterium]
MALLEIKTIPDPVLRRKAQPVTKIDDETRELIDNMVETMREAPGVGLAAPQVGISQRIIVVEYTTNEDDMDAPKKLFTMVNPEMKILDDEKIMGVEGCLSLPGLLGEIDRAYKVSVKGFNRQGNRVRVKAEGWLARIFQHEIDHLDGIVFTDRATRIWKPEPDEDYFDNV